MWLKKFRSPDDGEAGGEAPQVPETVQAPVAPVVDQTAQRLAALEAQNQQLMQQNQYLMMQGQAPRAPQQAAGDDLPSTDDLHPDLVKLLKHRDTQWEQRLDGLRDQFDHTSYAQQVRAAGVPNEVSQQAEGLFASWKQNGMKVANGSGEMVAPTRMDAMRFVMGSMAMEGKLPSFKPSLPAMQGTPMRASAPVEQVVVDTSKMSRAQRIAFYETQLDSEGF